MLAPPPQDQHRRHASSPTDRSNESNGATSSTARAKDDERIDHNKQADASHHAKHLDSSKDVVLDAQVMQRRRERALGLAIRAGQARGEIGSRHDNRYTMSTTTSDRVVEKASPYDFAKPSELQGVRKSGGIYAMVDGTSAEDREAGLAAARAEGNVSRANVVRKIKEANGTAPAAEPTRQHENMR